MNKETLVSVLALVSAFTLSACATSEKVQVSQVGDHTMSCKELADEMVKLDTAQSNVDSKKGVTGTNVASAILWLPGLAYTYYDAGQATEKISERRSHLSEIFSEKHCDPHLLQTKEASAK